MTIGFVLGFEMHLLALGKKNYKKKSMTKQFHTGQMKSKVHVTGLWLLSFLKRQIAERCCSCSLLDSINKHVLPKWTKTKRQHQCTSLTVNWGGTVTVSESHILGPSRDKQTQTEPAQWGSLSSQFKVCWACGSGFQYFIYDAAHYRLCNVWMNQTGGAF